MMVGVRTGLLLLCLSVGLLSAEDRWNRHQTGPFELYTNASDKTAREALNQLEQTRHTLSTLTGRESLDSRWPIRVLLPKSGGTVAMPVLARDSYIAQMPSNGVAPPALMRSIALLLLEQNMPQYSEGLRGALATVVSVLDIKGPKILLGALPAANERTPDWALLELVTTDPRYSGKVRVLLSNLAKGVDEKAAYRNAFDQPRETLQQQADVLANSGAPAPAPISGKVLLERDFRPEPLLTVESSVARADLLLSQPSQEQAANKAYTALVNQFADRPEPWEGLGFLSLRAKQESEARRAFEQAKEKNSKNARAWVALASLTSDAAAAKELLTKAAQLAPKWAEPQALLAERETGKNAKAARWLAVVKLEPNNSQYWKSLALAQESADQFDAAAKSWATAETTALTELERVQLREQRAAADQQRFEQAAAERKRLADERERDIQRVRNEQLARIRAAEGKTSQDLGGGEVVAFQKGPAADAQVEGQLQKVECLKASQLRLVILTTAQKRVQLLVPDAASLLLVGSKEPTLVCGPRAAAPVLVKYATKRNAALATVGEAASVEFR